MEDSQVAAALSFQLTERIGAERYELWFGAQTQLDLSPQRLRVISPSSFLRDWLRSHVRRERRA